jgi:hypothetical protein
MLQLRFRATERPLASKQGQGKRIIAVSFAGRRTAIFEKTADDTWELLLRLN